MPEQIFPTNNQGLREHQEELLHQKGLVAWFTGLSGAGKSTIAQLVQKELQKQKKMVVLLDGDNLRSGINANLGFSAQDRYENIRRTAHLASLLVQNGIIVLACLICPTEDMRQNAQSIIGKEDFHLVFVDANIQTCIQRDVKGLYQKALTGILPDFTGISAPFDVPMHADVHLQTDQKTIELCVQQLTAYIVEKSKKAQ